jgi:hypothetical protein
MRGSLARENASVQLLSEVGAKCYSARECMRMNTRHARNSCMQPHLQSMQSGPLRGRACASEFPAALGADQQRQVHRIGNLTLSRSAPMELLLYERRPLAPGWLVISDM